MTNTNTAYALTTCPRYVRATPGLRPVETSWGNDAPPPAIGARVKVNFNGFGAGTVVGYFIEEHYLGLEVTVDEQPAWHRNQGGTNPIHIFGPEFETITDTETEKA